MYLLACSQVSMCGLYYSHVKIIDKHKDTETVRTKNSPPMTLYSTTYHVKKENTVVATLFYQLFHDAFILTSLRWSTPCFRDESNNCRWVSSLTIVGKYWTNLSRYCFMYRLPVLLLLIFSPPECFRNSLDSRQDVTNKEPIKGMFTIPDPSLLKFCSVGN